MTSKQALKIAPLATAYTSQDAPAVGLCVAQLIDISANGYLIAQVPDAIEPLTCMWLDTGSSMELHIGDQVLIHIPASKGMPTVMGRVGQYRRPQPQANVTVEATETLTLKCGDASVDLRADGKVMVRGEDVLLRAKGTQSIRAGNVSIN